MGGGSFINIIDFAEDIDFHQIQILQCFLFPYSENNVLLRRYEPGVLLRFRLFSMTAQAFHPYPSHVTAFIMRSVSRIIGIMVVLLILDRTLCCIILVAK